MDNRARARELAARYLAKGDPTGWFEQLYREAESGRSVIPWADLRPNPNLLEFWRRHPMATSGKAALKIGCGLGDDAEQLAEWGFQTAAFDISAAAVRACQQRFPGSRVEYRAADLFNPPREWAGRFDFVLECYTLQVLPLALRQAAIPNAANFLKPGGKLLLITRGRGEAEPEGDMPWPLTRAELRRFAELGLRELSFEDYFDQESPPVHRFRALYEKPAAGDL